MKTDEERVAAPAAFFVAERSRFKGAAGPILDLACGQGRHAALAVEEGHSVVALDRNASSLVSLVTRVQAAARARKMSSGNPGSLRTLEVDLETDAGPPDASDHDGLLAPNTYSAVLVFRYLHRPLAAWIESLLMPGGILLYETFTTEQRALGWGPKRDAFLLEPGELRGLFPGLEVVSFAEGRSEDVQPAETARLVARKSGA